MTEKTLLNYVSVRLTSAVPNIINQIQCHFQPSNTKPKDIILGNTINLREVTENSNINSKIAKIINQNNNTNWPRIFSFDFIM